MNTPSNPEGSRLDLSRDEQWVVHHVMLDRLELDARSSDETSPPPARILEIFHKIEDGTYRFTRSERKCLREELREYAQAAATPERDRPVARAILAELQRSTDDDTDTELVPTESVSQRD